MVTEAITVLTEIQTRLINFNFEEWLVSQLNNDFLIAAIFAAASAILLWIGRSFLPKIWRAIKRRLMIVVTINNDNPYFVDLADEMNRNAIQLFSRLKSLDKSRLTIGFGNSFSRFQKHFVVCSRVKEQSDSHNFKQFLEMKFFFKSNRTVEGAFASFIKQIRERDHAYVKVWQFTGNYHSPYVIQKINPRTRDSLFVDTNLLSHIESRIEFFDKNERWYRQRGIPYKYSVLLTGVPGTGKTTLVRYLSGFANRDIILTEPKKLSGLTSFLNMTPDENDEFYDPHEKRTSEKKFIVLIEDIDCYKAVQTREKKDGDDAPDDALSELLQQDLASVLNSIEGIGAPEDFILLATTNHPEKLDPALLRPGRFDDIIEIPKINHKEISNMLAYFIKDEKFLKKIKNIKFEPITAAKVQDLIMQNLSTPDKILDSLPTINSRTEEGDTLGKAA